MRKIALISLTFLLAACEGRLITAGNDDSKEDALILEDEALGRELTTSPIREVPFEFVRVGAIWDADVAPSIEIATSADGQTWSAFEPLSAYHVEAEDRTSFVGEHELADPARFYRLRAGEGVATFLSLEFMEYGLSDEVEDGEQGVDALAAPAAFAVGDASVNNRASWGAKAPRCQSNHSPFRLTIHHTVTPTNDSMSPQARLRQIQAFHQNTRGWCDIGYHFLVSRDGRLWEGRPSNKLGSHVGGANSGNVGISFMGTHTSTTATSTQVNNTAALVRGVGAQYGISISSSTVKGHRDRGSSSCPGDALYGQIGTIITKARDGGGGGGDPTPTPGTATVKGLIYEGTNTGARIAGATVTLGQQSTTTSSSGYYEFTNVSAGTYTITASKSGFLTQTITRDASGETWGSIGLSRDLPQGTAVVQGVVYTDNDSSNRVPGATIQLSTGQSVTADGNGFFRIRELPPGPVTITASAQGFPTRSINRVLSNDTTVWGSVHLP